MNGSDPIVRAQKEGKNARKRPRPNEPSAPPTKIRRPNQIEILSQDSIDDIDNNDNMDIERKDEDSEPDISLSEDLIEAPGMYCI